LRIIKKSEVFVDNIEIYRLLLEATYIELLEREIRPSDGSHWI
jgi:hypothetical protein